MQQFTFDPENAWDVETMWLAQDPLTMRDRITVPDQPVDVTVFRLSSECETSRESLDERIRIGPGTEVSAAFVCFRVDHLESLGRGAVYARHVGVAAIDSLDFYCAGFANAYDLTMAGRCHGTGAPPASRVCS